MRLKIFLFGILSIIIMCVSCGKDIIPKDNQETPTDTIDGSKTSYTSDYLFDIEKVSEIRLDVEAAEWNKFLNYFDQNQANEECVPAKFTYKKGSEIFELSKVGVRLRGNTSRRRPEGGIGQNHNTQNPDWHHCHFVVKFQEYDDDVLFCENDRITLKWFKDDAAYCREVYCYDLFRRFGVYTAPRVAYTRLTINIIGDPKPAYFGVYVLLEGVNDSYLTNRKKAGYFQSNKGNLWKANFGANLSPSSMGNGNFGVEKVKLDASLSEYFIYDLKTNKKKLDIARPQLQNFVNEMNVLPSGSAELKTYLEQKMDIDLFLRASAVNVMVGMWDDYWNNTNNFYFYFDVDGKFYFIPFDYDNTLGTSSLMDDAGTQNPLAWGDLSGERMLMRKIMSIPEYQQQYKDYLKALATSDELFKTEGSKARINNWHAKIRNFVINDTGEDSEIIDRPAAWGNCSFYRLLSGNNNTNFFSAKILSLDF